MHAIILVYFLPQPEFNHIQYLVSKLRAQNSESSDELQSIKDLMNSWSFSNVNKNEKAFWIRKRTILTEQYLICHQKRIKSETFELMPEIS